MQFFTKVPTKDQLLPRKHEVFRRSFFFCSLYEGNLKLTSILTAFLQASQHSEGATWLLLAGAGHPKLGNPWFEQLLPRKHEVFRKSSPILSTLRREFEADIHFDPIFARKPARRALILQLYEGSLRLPSIPTAFLRGSLRPGGATGIRSLP